MFSLSIQLQAIERNTRSSTWVHYRISNPDKIFQISMSKCENKISLIPWRSNHKGTIQPGQSILPRCDQATAREALRGLTATLGEAVRQLNKQQFIGRGLKTLPSLEAISRDSLVLRDINEERRGMS